MALYQSGAGLGALVGVGTTNPTSNLQVYGTPIAAGNVFSVLNTAASGNVAQFSSSAGTALIINANGNVGIGKTNPGTLLDVNGALTATTISGTTLTASTAMNTSGSGVYQVAGTTVIDASRNLIGTHYGIHAGSNTFSGSNVLIASGLPASIVQGSNAFVFSNASGFANVMVMNTLGRVGLGTTNPSYLLDVAGDINLTGTLRQNGTVFSGSQWTTGTNNVYFLNSVGIGTSIVTYPLTVTSIAGASKAAPYSNLAYQSGGWYQAYQASTAATLKIFTDGNIGCTEVDVFSDRRIKKDIKDFDTTESLNIIKRLRLREFKYTDPVEHGTKTYKGLVAQEVLEVVDEAVALHQGIVPTIFQVPTSFQGSVAQFANEIQGISVGDTIKVLDEESERPLIVIRLDPREIEFSEPLVGPRIFVYGQVVKDLHTVSYDRLVPLLIGAIQALASK